MKQSKKNTPFEQLVENALDFTATSIRQLEQEPKYSVINFYTAVELFLKARLVDEHWSLAVSNLQKATKQNFDQADFLSIGLDEAKLRIKNTLPEVEDLTEGEFKAYDALRRRRNKAVHFYHPDYLGVHQPEVAVEQSLAWRYLYRRLKTTWKLCFEVVADRIDELNKGILSYGKYFDVVFDDFKKRLEEENEKRQKSGKAVSPLGFCVSCERHAVKIVGKRHAKHVFSGVCQVCDHEQPLITLPCKQCSKEVAVSPWKMLSCLNCDSESSYDPESLEADVEANAGDESWGYCHLCTSGPSASVMPFLLDNGQHALLCVYCFQFSESDSLAVCGYCGSMVTGEYGSEMNPGCVRCIYSIDEEYAETSKLPSLEEWRTRQAFHRRWSWDS